jgi:outer membrane receptor protein involved in Fe transport
MPPASSALPRLLLALVGVPLTCATAADQSAPPPPAPGTVVLSPFTVNTDKDDGFAAANAGTATRLSLDMKDVPAAYSVMTREFIDALGITNVQDAASWAPNGSGTPPEGNSQDAFQQPMQFNIRGVNNNSGQQRNNYLTSGVLESYALERYDFGRGPNAALFNIGGGNALGGGLGAQTKRARYDRAFDTVALTGGSWNYKRATLDVNRPLTDKLAVRANAVWFDRDGWRMNEFERTRGATVTGSYLIRPKTEFRIEGAYDRTERTIPAVSIFDGVTGWDGVTVFNGPITNAILGTQTVPGAPNGLGQVLTFQGERQGVDRYNGQFYVWDPFSGANAIQNYQNTGYTRRGDATANTPLLANGTLYIRSLTPAGAAALPFGNGATGSGAPSSTQINNEANLLNQPALPADRFNRVLAGSKFRLPDERFTQATEEPILIQDTKDVNFALSHQFGENWFFEVGADVNKVSNRSIRNGTAGANSREVRVDINQVLPNGTANPHFLEPYNDMPIEFIYRNFTNRSARANLGHRRNAGKWGDYTFNLNVSASRRTTDNYLRKLSMATLPDPRMWQSNADQVNIRQYWSNPSRPYGEDSVPATLVRKVYSADNNSSTTTTETLKPRWVLANWDTQDENFNYGVLALSAKFFGGKLVILGAERYDRYSSKLKQRVEFGELPTTWNGTDKIYKPDAPADWTRLSYIPRSTAGVPTSAQPIPAANRPRVNPPGVTTNNGVQIADPLYSGDRFRNDYSPPENRGDGLTGSYGFVYHALPFVSVVSNYSTAYIPPPTNQFTLNNDLAVAQEGYGYDVGLRFTLFGGRLTANTNYFFNQEDNQRVAAPTTASVNALLGRNAATDPGTGGRNTLGIPDIFGSDYRSAKTSGYELELVGKINRGWRVMFNAGTAEVFEFNRYPLARVLVPQNAETYRQVLEAAGGRLDTTQRPNGAPGLAVVNSAITAALPSEQTNAVIDYNNVWANYAVVASDKPAQGQNRLTVNVFSDYTVQSGRLRGLRVGLGAQAPGRNYVGSRNADTIVDPANPTRAIDDPAVDFSTPVYVQRPTIVTATFGYSWRPRSGWRRLDGKEIQFQFVVKNLLNNQSTVYQGLDVVARPPDGDFSKPNRVTIAPRNGVYTEPISFRLTTTLKL